jgi:photosystem II stability/assembly factor-like uncharacterized protein
MKKSLLLSIALLLSGFSTFAQWEHQISGTANFITSVYFTRTDKSYASAAGGVILKTINGGENWDPMPSGTTTDLYGIFFTDANTGYVVGFAGTILKTTDGGASWTPQSSGTSNFLVRDGISNIQPIC